MGFFGKKINKVVPAPSNEPVHPVQYGDKHYIVYHVIRK